MNTTEAWLAAALIGLIVAAAILGAGEAALLRVPRVRVEVDAENGSRPAATLLRLLDDLPRALNTVLLVVLLVQIAAAAISGVLADRVFGSLGVTIASMVLTAVLFVYSEALPKTYAVSHPVRVGYATAPLFAGLVFILRPIVAVLMWFANLQAPGTAVASTMAPTDEELARLAAEAADTGTIDETDRRLIERALELGDRDVDEIYVPRPDIVAVSAMSTVREVLDLAVATGHRRIPVFDRDIDEIVGVVSLAGLAGAVVDRPDDPVSTIAETPLVVPESKAVVELLGEMQQSGTHFAVVVDEFGGTSGIVTIEDVVSRLVGRISDAVDATVEGFVHGDDGTWTVPGSASIDDFERATGFDLPEGDWTTVAGVLVGYLDRLPSEGDAVDVDGVHLEVLATGGHRVTLVRAASVASPEQ